MTQHRHTIPKGANQTASVTDPDLTPLTTRVTKLEASMANALLRIAAVEAPYTPPAPPAPPADLQAAINAASPGGTVIATGGTYSGTFTINKALTLIGGAITFTSTAGLIITASGVIANGTTVVGPGDSTYVAGEYGIWAHGTAGSPLTGIVIENCNVSQCRSTGVWAEDCTSPTISGNTVTDVSYAGIMAVHCVGGTIDHNTVTRVGYTIAGTSLPGPYNSYGIAVTEGSDGLSSDVTVSYNVVSDVPWWHALDTHSGQRITFLNNTVQRSSRGLFITDSSIRPLNIVVTGNQILAPSPATYNLLPVTLYNVNGCTFTGNTLTGWGGASPTPPNPWYDYGGLSTGLVNGGGNVITP